MINKRKIGFDRFLISFFLIILLILIGLFYFPTGSQNKKIDFHQHMSSSANISDYFKVMELFNIEKGVMLSLRDLNNSDVYKRSNDFMLQLQEDYPDEIIAYTTIEEEDADSINVFKEDVANNSRGLKLMGWHLFYIRKYNLSLADENMYALYEFCDSKGLPIMLHLRLSHSEEYYDELERILSDFQNLKIILAHGGLDLGNLSKLDALMGVYSNLYFDLSFYGTYHEYWFMQVSNYRDEFRNIILNYPDRVLWGTDVYPSRTRGYDYMVSAINCSIKLVEEKTFVCPVFENNESLNGLYLPPKILDKVYYENAIKLLN